MVGYQQQEDQGMGMQAMGNDLLNKLNMLRNNKDTFLLPTAAP